MGNFAEVLAENPSKNVNISVYNEVKTKYIHNQVYSYGFNEENHQHLRLILIGVRRVATISVNPNTRSTGAATISINPARHTSKADACGRGGYNRYLQSWTKYLGKDKEIQ